MSAAWSWTSARTRGRSRGTPIELGPTDFGLLAVLARHAGQVLSKAKLLELVWGYEPYDENLVVVRVSLLRQQLGPEAARPDPDGAGSGLRAQGRPATSLTGRQVCVSATTVAAARVPSARRKRGTSGSAEGERARAAPSSFQDGLRVRDRGCQGGGGLGPGAPLRHARPAVAGFFRLQRAAEPDDLTSEVFLGVLRNLHRFRGDEAQFRSWVFTIAYRRLADERRSAGAARSSSPCTRRRIRSIRPTSRPTSSGSSPPGGSGSCAPTCRPAAGRAPAPPGGPDDGRRHRTRPSGARGRRQGPPATRVGEP